MTNKKPIGVVYFEDQEDGSVRCHQDDRTCVITFGYIKRIDEHWYMFHAQQSANILETGFSTQMLREIADKIDNLTK